VWPMVRSSKRSKAVVKQAIDSHIEEQLLPSCAHVLSIKVFLSLTGKTTHCSFVKVSNSMYRSTHREIIRR